MRDRTLCVHRHANAEGHRIRREYGDALRQSSPVRARGLQARAPRVQKQRAIALYGRGRRAALPRELLPVGVRPRLSRRARRHGGRAGHRRSVFPGRLVREAARDLAYVHAAAGIAARLPGGVSNGRRTRPPHLDELRGHRPRSERQQRRHNRGHGRSSGHTAAEPFHRVSQPQVLTMRLSIHRRSARWLGLALTTIALVVACRDITSLAQENPGSLSGATLYVPGNAQLIVNGAISDFECAYARYVVGSGLFTDELSVGISNTTNFDYDARRLLTASTYGTNHCGATPSSTQQPGIYTPLSTARATTDTAAAYLELWTDAQVANRTKLLGPT